MSKNRDFAEQIKISEIKSEYFYRALAILGVKLTQLSTFKGKHRTFYAKRKELNLYSEDDARTLKKYCEEKYGDGVFEDKIYQASLDFKNLKTNRQQMINKLENQEIEIARLNKENEELKEEIRQLKNRK